MSTLAAPDRRQSDTRPPALPWRRMTWVIWRQHRFGMTSVAAFLGVLGLAMWLAGMHLHHAYAAAASCRPASSSLCAGLANTFGDTNTLLADGYLLQVVPALVGAFLGAPLLARELETGTFRYAWTQGLGRSRWTVAKLAALAVFVALAAAAFSFLLSWYYHPYFAAGPGNLPFYEMSPLAGGLFSLRGIALSAWALAAFSIGCLAGTVIRRIVPAIVITLAVYTGLVAVTGLSLRQRYMTPLVTSHLQLVEGPKISPLGTNWILSQGYTKAGRPIGQPAVEQIIREAPTASSQKGFDPTHYLTQHGYTVWTHYQPAARFWRFQWIEGGWLLALSLLLLVATVWLVRRRAS